MAHARFSTLSLQNKIGVNSDTTAIRTNQRLAITAADTTLNAKCTGGTVPLYLAGPGTTVGPAYPVAVELQVEVADAANLTYVTCDGGAASATLGMQVPIGPNPPMRIEIDGRQLGSAVHLYATVGTAHVQARFFYED